MHIMALYNGVVPDHSQIEFHSLVLVDVEEIVEECGSEDTRVVHDCVKTSKQVDIDQALRDANAMTQMKSFISC